MEILIDTDVILDALLKRSPFAEDSYSILKMADETRRESSDSLLS